MMYIVLILLILLGIVLIFKDKPKDDRSFFKVVNEGIHLRIIIFTITCFILLIILLIKDCSS